MFLKTVMDMVLRKLKHKRDPSVQTDASYRLLLVIKARWFIVGLLLIHGLLGFSAHMFSYSSASTPITIRLVFEEASKMALTPFMLVMFTVAYNAFYHIGWYKLPKIWEPRVRKYIVLQLLSDILFVLLLVHFTGGVTSWLWPLLLLINFELAFLLSAKSTILAIGLLAGTGYTALILLEYNKIISSYQVPYYQAGLHQNPVYVILIILWVNLICGFTLFVSSFLLESEHLQLKDRINKDGLTKLYNRRYFNHRLNSEIKRAVRYNRVVSLIMFDIDNFKHYNDTYGHTHGDNLLRWIADIFKLNVRRSDKEQSYEIDIACRYGGEEFAIILPETDTDASKRTAEKIIDEIESLTSGAVSFAERIRTTVESSKFINKKGVTVSAGISCFPADGKDEKQIVEAADKALYAAKTTGKNKIIIASDIKNVSRLKKDTA